MRAAVAVGHMKNFIFAQNKTRNLLTLLFIFIKNFPQ